MAPAPEGIADESDSLSLALPQSVSVPPMHSGADQEADVAEGQSVSGLEGAQFDLPGPVTTAKQGRLVVPGAQAPFPVAMAKAPRAGATVVSGDEQVAALAVEEPQRKSLAQSALSLVSFSRPDEPGSNVDRLIEKYAQIYEVPVSLVRRVVKRESNFRPSATNRGHYGLMQIKPATARSMGYRGTARGLLDAETNLKYAVKYLRGAYLVADGNHDRADRLYQSGYYYDAKRKGLLDETGLGKDRRRRKS